MNYIKFFISIHIKYWWVNILTFMTFGFGFVFTGLGGFVLVTNGVPLFLIFMIGSFIYSSPLIPVNYIIAKKYYEDIEAEKKFFLVVLCNHLVTYILYSIIFGYALRYIAMSRL